MKSLSEIIAVLRNGGVVMHSTETCYGFAVDIFNEKALEKLYKLKGRDAGKPVSILVADLGMAKKYGEFSDKALGLARKYWPGPLSIVVPRTSALPEWLNKGEKFISIRVSSDSLCSSIPKRLGGPVTTTSANTSGNQPLYEVDLSQFGELASTIDLVIDKGKLPNNKPSTLVKINGDKVDILRQGDLTVE